jgi:multiple sugar transport system substrate-binding protein
MKSRGWVLAAAASALALTAAACSSAGGATSDPGTGAVTLTVWSYYSGPQQLEALKQQDQLFEKAHPNVTVDQVQVAGSELDPKLLAAAAAKTGPDVFLDNVVVDFPELVAAGALYPLTQDWNSYPGRSQYPAAGIWKSKGQIYNIMSYSNLLGLYYNKSILDQYHLPVPTTMTQLESDMAVVTKAGKYGAMAAAGSPTTDGAWTWYPILLDRNVSYCNTTAANMTPMFQTAADWTASGYLPKAAATWNQSDSWTQFSSGNFAFGINGNWNLGDAKSLKFQWGTTQLPGGPDGSHVFPGGEGLSISPFSAHKQLAWEYLETAWLSQQANEVDFTDSGQIPTRADVATSAAVKADTNAAAFVAATKTVSAWPNNSNTSEMQTTVGTELSDVISGQASPAQAAAATSTAINNDIKAGGGDC